MKHVLILAIKSSIKQVHYFILHTNLKDKHIHPKVQRYIFYIAF